VNSFAIGTVVINNNKEIIIDLQSSEKLESE
jgi:hypothetical protein